MMRPGKVVLRAEPWRPVLITSARNPIVRTNRASKGSDHVHPAQTKPIYYYGIA